MQVLIIIAVAVVALGLAVWGLSKGGSCEPTKKAVREPMIAVSQAPPPERFITPAVFEVGPTSMGDRYRSAGQCNDKVLYPVNGVEVDYGSKMPNNCPCTEFIQPP